MKDVNWFILHSKKGWTYVHYYIPLKLFLYVDKINVGNSPFMLMRERSAKSP